MEGQILYELREVMISTSQARFGGVSFPIKSIRSARIDAPPRGGAMAVGVVVCAFGSLFMLDRFSDVGLVFLALGSMVLASAVTMRHKLILRIASNDVRVPISKNFGELEDIKVAIERATFMFGSTDRRALHLK
jgi:hypothetical protein